MEPRLHTSSAAPQHFRVHKHGVVSSDAAPQNLLFCFPTSTEPKPHTGNAASQPLLYAYYFCCYLCLLFVPLFYYLLHLFFASVKIRNVIFRLRLFALVHFLCYFFEYFSMIMLMISHT
jgi:hypothetical protein